MKNPSATGMGANPVCGDVMTLFLETTGDKITSAAYKTMGCGAAIASGSILTEMLKGLSVDQARAITPKTLLEKMGGLPDIKLHCPDLAIEALKATLKDLDLKLSK
jgi:nitrogen fixation NifU-like protein